MATFNSYLSGFVISIVLTLAAYYAVTTHSFHSLGIIFCLAILQLLIQLIFFFDLGKGKNSEWNLLFLGFAVMIVLILVGGSLWIMNNLNYNMTPAQMNASMLDQAE